MRTDKTSVPDLIHDMSLWVDELMLLRDIILSTGLKEEIKWGGPIYTYNGKNIVAIGGFKNYCAIWFHNGVFLKDPEKVLVNASEGKTRGLRQWRFTSMKEIKPAIVKRYIKEAIENEKEGKRIKPEKKPLPEIPAELALAFKRDKALKDAYAKLSLGKMREYLDHIHDAKTAETRHRRVEKTIPMIKAGIGLNDRYK
jgi:uncharacterized protein YdeI (YjbR/CyaY-like superfamily)